MYNTKTSQSHVNECTSLIAHHRKVSLDICSESDSSGSNHYRTSRLALHMPRRSYPTTTEGVYKGRRGRCKSLGYTVKLARAAQKCGSVEG